MKNEPGINGEPAPLPLQEQVEQLKQGRDQLLRRVQEMEEEQQRLRQSLAAVQEERDVYLYEVHTYLRKECSYEQALEFFQNIREEDCISSAELLAECDRVIAEYEQQRGSRPREAS